MTDEFDDIDDRIRASFHRRAEEARGALDGKSAGVAEGAVARRRRTGRTRYLAVAAVLAVVVAGGIVWQSSGDDAQDVRSSVASPGHSDPTGASGGPILNQDHWHAAFGIDDCGRWLPDPVDATRDLLGIHTHGDGLIHVHPFAREVSGRNATLAKFLDQMGVKVSPDSVTLADGTELRAADGCGGKPARLALQVWPAGASPASFERFHTVASPQDAVITEDGMAFVIAIEPVTADAWSPPPSSLRLRDPMAAEQGRPLASEPTTTTTPDVPRSVTTTTAVVLAPGEMLLEPDGVASVLLADVIVPAVHPTYADGSVARIVDGRPGDPSREIAHMCDWTTDMTSRPGVTLTLERTSLGRVVVGIRPDHAVTPHGIRPGMSWAELSRRFGTFMSYPTTDATGKRQFVMGATGLPYALHFYPAETVVVGISVEDGINSPVGGVGCH
jgi:hypothetical protein